MYNYSIINCKEPINSIIRREMLMGSPLFEEWAKRAELDKRRLGELYNYIVFI